MISLESMVAETLVDDGDQRVALNVPRKVEMPMRFVDVPFLLELGSCLSIVYTAEVRVSKRMRRLGLIVLHAHTAFQKVPEVKKS